jgi:hypothetical protein
MELVFVMLLQEQMLNKLKEVRVRVFLIRKFNEAEVWRLINKRKDFMRRVRPHSRLVNEVG